MPSPRRLAQVVRAVHGGRATGNFLGRIDVARDAQKTDAAQNFKALLLERGASANAKPELEIFADDVKCAHGARSARWTRWRATTWPRAASRRASQEAAAARLRRRRVRRRWRMRASVTAAALAKLGVWCDSVGSQSSPRADTARSPSTGNGSRTSSAGFPGFLICKQISGLGSDGRLALSRFRRHRAEAASR